MGVVPRVWGDVGLKEVIGIGKGVSNSVEKSVGDLESERLGVFLVFLLVLLDEPVD